MDKHADITAISQRRRLIKRKKLLRGLYECWYSQMMEDIHDGRHNNDIIELGAGGSFIKEMYPQVVCTDILPAEGIDLACDCRRLSFKNTSVSRFIMINVFHHLSDPEEFLNQAQRCLIEGGEIIMIEPANTLWGRFVWKNFHREPYCPKIGQWTTDPGSPLQSGNGILAWIVFERDRDKFNEKFPGLRIEKYYAHTPLSYLLSGGFSYPSMVPDFCIKPLIKFDAFLCRLSREIGMFITIKLRKRQLGE